MTTNSIPPIQVDKFTWKPADQLRYFNPVTGKEISREEWRRIVARRAKRIEDRG